MKHDTKHDKHEAKRAAEPEAKAAAKPEADAPSTEVPATAPARTVAPLPASASLADVIARVNELVDRANSKRDRGPVSTKEMTEEDACRAMLGDLKDAKHTKAAEVLGLSYGQVYSARKGFTYKGVYQKSDKRW